MCVVPFACMTVFTVSQFFSHFLNYSIVFFENKMKFDFQFWM